MTIREGQLVLADGSVFEGELIGAEAAGGIATGEVVFNTALSGYQEIITDPSYAGQIITSTSQERLEQYAHPAYQGAVEPTDDGEVRVVSGESRSLEVPIPRPGALSVRPLPGRPQGRVAVDGQVTREAGWSMPAAAAVSGGFRNRKLLT